jgi:DNA-formamidopyrimidine glycosylase
MPEGHTIRHLATLHDNAFVGTAIKALSPQGRFAEGAAHLDGKTMTKATAHGKHLFLHFDEDIVHIHLGLYGWFKLRKNKEQQATENTRLRIVNDLYVSDLSAPTKCEILDIAGVKKIEDRLGEDPLHTNADKEKVWEKIKKSSKSIGALLMDQSVIAGIGNVYRAEILFLANLSPFIPGKQVSREAFDHIWNDSVRLLHIGAIDGRIMTVAQEHMTGEEVKVHGCAQLSYAYKQTGNPCRLCSTTVMQQEMAGRQLYWCPTCQA